MRRPPIPIEQMAIADDFGNGAEWYLTIRCARSECRQLIAFQKAVYPGDQPNLRFAITGNRQFSVRIAEC